VLEEAALEELAQDTFHHRPQGPMLPDEAGGPDSQQLLEGCSTSRNSGDSRGRLGL
jgi:hypothetical protein